MSRRFGSRLILATLLIVGLFVPVFGQEFTQGFRADEKLLRGAIVDRVENDDSKVVGAVLSNLERLYGVVVRSNETAVSLTVDPAGVLVATSGRYEMLISNINGEVKEGDYLTSSALKGVAMRADERQDKTLGRALQSFDTSDPNQVLATRTVTANDGQARTVAVGRVLADLDIRSNPLAGVLAPEVLIKLGESIAGGPVSVTRIWGALGVLVLSFITGSVIFYAGVRTSIIAIGRNPLSKGSVLRGFLQVTAISLIIFIVGGFAVYLILKL
ncbi:MAG TPA: hypothetical protein VGA08_03260 [Candidatus Saccharimonadales bacterium]